MKKSETFPANHNSGRPLRSATFALAFLMLLAACTTPKYILDNDSAALQKKIHNKRFGNVFGDIFLTTGSALVAVFTGIYVAYVPGGQSLKKIVLKNVSTDPLQVNMLTDMIWKDSTYADVMNIRIPPGETCRLLLPSGAVYNLYFSNTFDTTDDDEFLVFDTSTMRKVTLYPGLTFLKDTIPPETVPADTSKIY